MNKKKILSTVCVCFAAVLVVGCASFFLGNQSNNNELRDKYPIISEADYMFDDPSFSFEQRVAIAPNIAEIEVVKKLPDYTVVVGDEAYGTSKEVVFSQYQVKLVSNISNTDILTKSDDTFVITFAKDFAPSYPVLEDNMNAICSIVAASGAHEGKYIFFDRSFYYVDEGIALSAYEGDDSPASKMCKKDTLIQQIKDIRSK